MNQVIFSEVETLRNDLAIEYGADFTCPMNTGIFLRIVAEYNFEKLNKKGTEISPFWRIIDPNSRLSDRLSFDKKIIINTHFVKFYELWTLHKSNQNNQLQLTTFFLNIIPT